MYICFLNLNSLLKQCFTLSLLVDVCIFPHCKCTPSKMCTLCLILRHDPLSQMGLVFLFFYISRLWFIFQVHKINQQPSGQHFPSFFSLWSKNVLNGSHGIAERGESGPGNSRLNGEKQVLLACSGTAPLAPQARWLIWFQCLVWTLARHSTLCHLLQSAWGDVAHVTSNRWIYCIYCAQGMCHVIKKSVVTDWSTLDFIFLKWIKDSKPADTHCITDNVSRGHYEPRDSTQPSPTCCLSPLQTIAITHQTQGVCSNNTGAIKSATHQWWPQLQLLLR